MVNTIINTKLITMHVIIMDKITSSEENSMKDKLKYSVVAAMLSYSVAFANSSKLTEGINYYKIGNYEKAAASFEEVLKEDPTNSAALSNLGFIYYRNGNYQKAKECLNKSLNYIKDKELIALTYYVLADIEKKNNNDDGYYRNLSTAISYKPDFSDAINELFDYLYARNEFNKIANMPVDTKKLSEKQELILAESYIKSGKNIKEAISILEKLKESKNTSISTAASQLLNSIKEDKQVELVKSPVDYTEKRQPQKLVKTFVEATYTKKMTKNTPIKKIEESDGASVNNQSITESDTEILKKLKENPSVEMFNKLGLVYLKQGKTEDAKNAFLSALKLDPVNIDALNNLGLLYFNLKDYDKAIKFFSDAIKRDNSSAEAYYNLGNTYYKLGEMYQNIGYFKNSIDNYKKAISLNSDHKSSYYNIGNAYFMIDDYRSAIEYYKKSDANNPKVRKNIAISYYNLALMEDHRDTAIEYLRNAISYNGSFKEAYYLLGKILYERGDYKDAITYLKDAYNMYSGSEKAEIIYLLGLAYSYSGDKDTAIKYYKELRPVEQSLADKLFDTLFH